MEAHVYERIIAETLEEAPPLLEVFLQTHQGLVLHTVLSLLLDDAPLDGVDENFDLV